MATEWHSCQAELALVPPLPPGLWLAVHKGKPSLAENQICNSGKLKSKDGHGTNDSSLKGTSLFCRLSFTLMAGEGATLDFKELVPPQKELVTDIFFNELPVERTV